MTSKPDIPPSFSLTTKQEEILKLIVNGNGYDKEKFVPIDLDQLLERLTYKTTKHSIQFSVRALMNRGFIEKGPMEKRRGRSRVVYLPTEYAVHKIRKLMPITIGGLAELPFGPEGFSAMTDSIEGFKVQEDLKSLASEGVNFPENLVSDTILG